MTSKNSYLKLSITNFKRRIPYLALGFIICFILLPLITYFDCLKYTNNFVSYDNMFVSRHFAETLATGNYLHDVAAIILAMLFAITGNAWNNSQKKNDFYKSLPVKERTRFIYINVNSIICFILCFAINLFLANLVVAGFKIYESVYLVASLFSLLVHTLEFIAVYYVALIAQLLTGNAILAICGTGVFCAAEPAMRMVIESLISTLFKNYTNYFHDGRLESIYKSLTTPVAGAIGAIHSVAVNRLDFANVANYAGIWPGIIKMIIQIVIFVLIAYWIYSIRPAQRGNKNFVFAKTKPFIKGLIMIPTIMVFELLVTGSSRGNLISVLGGFVVILVISHILLQFVIEGEFAAVKRGFISTGLTSLIIIMIMGSIFIGAKPYDRYMPKMSDVESVSIITGDEYKYNLYTVDDYLQTGGSYEYFIKDVNIEDKAFINVLFAEIDKTINTGVYSIEGEKLYDYDDSGKRYKQISVSYNLKNGKRIMRSYVVSVDSYSAIKLALWDTAEYREATNQVDFFTNKEYIRNAKSIEMKYINFKVGDSTFYLDGEMLQREMLLAMSKDHNMRGSDIYEKEFPIGTTHISINMPEGTCISFEMPLYESDVNTMAVLNTFGYEPEIFDASEIDRIQITKYDERDGRVSRVILTQKDQVFRDLIDRMVINKQYNNSFVDETENRLPYEVYLYDINGDYMNGIILPGTDVTKLEKLLAEND